MAVRLPWPRIRTVLLDMDGTLLDLRFDNHFWRESGPERYARSSRHVPGAGSRPRSRPAPGRWRGRSLGIAWITGRRELALDIVALKREIEHLIAVHPHVLDFLDALRAAGKRVVLVTNAHPHSLALKMEKTRLAGHFDQHRLRARAGLVKEQADFGRACASGNRSIRPRRCWWMIIWRSCAPAGLRDRASRVGACGQIRPIRRKHPVNFRRSTIFPSCCRSVEPTGWGAITRSCKNCNRTESPDRAAGRVVVGVSGEPEDEFTRSLAIRRRAAWAADGRMAIPAI
jgi:FMN phosphatase YigB (HAD superfamily)